MIDTLLLYSHNDNTSWNIIKHNFTNFSKRTHTLLYQNISFTLYSQKVWCFCGVWKMGGERYTKREVFFISYLLPGARWCQHLHPLASSSETPLINCVSLTWLQFSALCLKLTAWFSLHDPLPVIHLFNLSALTCRHLAVY